MDDLDRKILALLAKNARMPVKEIAEQVALTSPAVSSRIHKLETDGIIGGYTVTLNRPADRVYVDALISLSVAPSKHEAFLHLIQNSKEVLQCYHVTGDYTFLIKVSCGRCCKEAEKRLFIKVLQAAAQFSPAVARILDSSTKKWNTMAALFQMTPHERKEYPL